MKFGERKCQDLLGGQSLMPPQNLNGAGGGGTSVAEHVTNLPVAGLSGRVNA
jgi:hypothetical protein